MSEYHLSADTLAGYAAGTLSDGAALLAAGHLTYCATCRAEVDRMEAMGGSFLECEHVETAQEESAGLSLAATMALIENSPTFDVEEGPAFRGAQIPTPILAAIGADEDDIKWKFRFPGISVYEFDGYDDETVQLLRAKPGATIPSHTHHGQEATLVLTGQLEDGGAVLNPGDVMQADHHDDHTPKIHGDEVCICLIVMSGKMKFTGPLSRALNLFG